VIDDGRSIRQLLFDLLTGEGFEVRTAESGLEGLSILESWKADLILLDLTMPVMDGWAFRAEQREAAAIRDIPVIILSADHNLMREQVQALETAAVLPKPCDLQALFETISHLVQPAPRGRRCYRDPGEANRALLPGQADAVHLLRARAS
jgi:CheY-like chemotaxis protein